MLFKLTTEVTVGEIVLGYNQDSAGILVKPVDDTRPERSSQFGQVVAMMQETVHKSRLSMAGSRMNHQAGRLVHGDQMIIFKDYVQGERFR